MLSLREYIKQAEKGKKAIGHFNFSNLETFWAIVKASKKLSTPVLLGLSEGERDFFGLKQAVALVKSLREEGLPIFLSADHTYSFERVKEAIEAGVHAVVVDGASLSYDENVALTKKAADFVKSAASQIFVEGEVGFIGKSSSLHESVPNGVRKSDPEEVAKFVKDTGIEAVAASVGNVHGVIVSGEPALDINLIRDIRKVSGVPLVLHGASGNSDEDVRKAVEAGVCIVHFNTELRLAYRSALKLSLQENPDEVAPYKYLKPAMMAVEEVVLAKLKVLNGL